VVQVTSVPVEGARAASARHNADAGFGSTVPLRALLSDLRDQDQSQDQSQSQDQDQALEKKSFAELRSLLLNHGTATRLSGGVDPAEAHMLNPAHVARVNAAEAAYWRSCSTGRDGEGGGEPPRVGFSNDILGFDCGSEQLVIEVAFPMGDIRPEAAEPPAKLYRDVEFVLRLLELIEAHGVPAPAPIEQRWTRSSSSLLSPAHAADPGATFCWVGVIVYLPMAPSAAAASDPSAAAALALEKQEATAAFQRYVESCVYPLLREFGAVPHWAKLETPLALHSRAQFRECLRREGGAPGSTSVCTAEQLQLLREMHPEGPEDAAARRARHARYRGPEHAALCEQLLERYPSLRAGSAQSSQFQQLLDLLDPQHLCTNELVEELLDLGAEFARPVNSEAAARTTV
jgi:hypothetical protein